LCAATFSAMIDTGNSAESDEAFVNRCLTCEKPVSRICSSEARWIGRLIIIGHKEAVQRHVTPPQQTWDIGELLSAQLATEKERATVRVKETSSCCQNFLVKQIRRFLGAYLVF